MGGQDDLMLGSNLFQLGLLLFYLWILEKGVGVTQRIHCCYHNESSPTHTLTPLSPLIGYQEVSSSQADPS